MLVGKSDLLSSLKINKNNLFIVLAIVLGFFRLYLTADRDILATNSPHDEFWYIHNAYNIFTNKNYDNMVMAHLPMYSYFLLLGSKLGIPARLFIDLLYLGGSFYLASVVYEKTYRNVLIGIGVFSFLIFHPYTLHYFDRALSENLLTCLTLLLVGLGIEIALNKSISLTKILIFSALLGISYSIRKEGIVLLAPLLFLWIGYSIFIKIYQKKSSLNNRFTKTLIYSVFSVMFVSLIICGANYYKWQSFATNELTSQGYSAAMKSLISIDAGPTPFQTSITVNMLRKGGEYSPTLKELNQYLDGEIGKGWMGISIEATLIPGEIGNGWFYWALRDSAAAAGWYKNPKIADTKYQDIANEINDAFASGNLNKRVFVVSSFVDPDYSKWVKNIFPTFKKLIKLLFYPDAEFLEIRSEDASPSQMVEYTQIAGRRNLLPSLEVSGWIQGDESYSALLYNNSVIQYEKISLNERPDVKGAYGFNLRSNYGILPNKICFYKKSVIDGNCLSIEVAKTGRVLELSNQHMIGIDKQVVENDTSRRLDKFLPLICQIYDFFTVGLIFLNIALLIFYAVKKQLSTYNAVFFFVILIFILSRVSLFSILGASSWSAMQARYLMPLIPFIALIIFPVAWRLKLNDI
jgi:hypothetical protein